MLPNEVETKEKYNYLRLKKYLQQVILGWRLLQMNITIIKL